MLKDSRLLFVLCSLASSAWAFSGDIATVELRLQTPVNSYSSARGSSIETVVIAPCMLGNRVLLPAGTVVRGNVRDRHQVGIGVLHERAGLDLDFNEYELPDGRRFRMSGRLRVIENARESVNKSGHVQGVLAADNPQRWLDGVWNRPSMTLFQHSLLGLTGMSGRVFTGFDMGPIGGAALIATRIALFSLPEPEIRFPAGTEMKVAITRLPDGAPTVPAALEGVVPEDLADWAKSQPFRTAKTNGHNSDDIINVAFIGTREQVIRAFHAAGWTEALPRTVRSLSHMWHSYATQTGYADAPAYRLLYQGAEPDFLFEKSLNTISMRDHVRIWQTDALNPNVWFGAATHDVGIRFDSTDKALTHRIDPRIDFERSKIVNDLSFAACTEPAGYVSRPGAVRLSVDPRSVATDGRLAVITLHDCAAPDAAPNLNYTTPARSIYVRSFRRVVLETRQYLLRENPYFWGYRAFRWNQARIRPPAFVDY